MRASAQHLGLVVEPLPAGPRDFTRLATLSLKISAVFCILAGTLLALAPVAWDPALTDDYLLRSVVVGVLALLCFGLAVLTLVTARGLRRRRRWAWRTALVLFVLYVPSLFLPLGAVGLFGLLSKGTRARFRAARRERIYG